MSANAQTHPRRSAELVETATSAWTAGLTPAAFDLGRETRGAWGRACEAWGSYVMDMNRLFGPMAVLEANTRLLADLTDLGAAAAAARLHDGGLETPLLSDA